MSVLWPGRSLLTVVTLLPVYTCRHAILCALLFFRRVSLQSQTHSFSHSSSHCSSHPSSCCPTPIVLLTHQAVVPHPLFFSRIKLLSHTKCSHPSSCCPTPTVLTHQAVVPHPLFFSRIKLLSHTNCSHPSSCCPTPTVLTHQAVVPHPLFFSPIKLLSNTHCSSHPSSCCQTPTVLLTHQAVVKHPLFFSPIQLLSHSHCSSRPSSCCPTPTVLLTHQAAVPHLRVFSLTGCCSTHIVHTHQPTVLLPLLNYSLSCPSSLWITLSHLPTARRVFVFVLKCVHARTDTHTQSLVPSAELCVHTVRKVDNCRWSLSHIWCNTGIKSDDYHLLCIDWSTDTIAGTTKTSGIRLDMGSVALKH